MHGVSLLMYLMFSSLYRIQYRSGYRDAFRSCQGYSSGGLSDNAPSRAKFIANYLSLLLQ